MAQLKAEVLDDIVLSGISDTGETSSAGYMGDPLIQTSTQLEKISHGPIRGKTCASNITKMERELR